MWSNWKHCPLLVGMQNSKTAMENIWRFLKKLELAPPYDLATPLMGIYPRELKSGSQKDISAPMPTAALLTVVKMRK